MISLDKIINNWTLYNEPSSLIEVSSGFVFSIISLLLLERYYKNFGNSLTGRKFVAPILPLIGILVFFIIVVIKGSLALSLGLIGALSIVRFRTPIKEPEELGFILFAIAIGLGFGSGLIFPSIAIITSIFIVLLLRNFLSSRNHNDETFSISITSESQNNYPQIIDLITKSNLIETEVFRIDLSKQFFQINVESAFKSKTDFLTLSEQLKQIDADVRISYSKVSTGW